jgi:hypothetical protein
MNTDEHKLKPEALSFAVSPAVNHAGWFFKGVGNGFLSVFICVSSVAKNFNGIALV